MKYIPKQEVEKINYDIEHPLRNFITLVTAAIVFACGLVFIFGAIGEKLLLAIGPEYEAKIFSSFSFPHDAVLPEADKILGKLIGAASKKYKVSILCEEQPNAFAFPGNTIVVTSGLLKLVSTENALAFVLGHEYGHFHHRHHLSGIGFALGASAALKLAGLDAVALAAFALPQKLIARKFNRTQEQAADKISIDLVAKVYGGLNGATEFFEKMMADEIKSNELALFSTHPVTNDRIEEIKKNSVNSNQLLPLQIDLKKLCPE
ncbi:M48 family metallopeptidase [bacterium]|nr:M48 family metallopeptidase [bacterium]